MTSEQFQMRMTAEFKQIAKEQADKKGLSIAAFLRMLVMEHKEREGEK